MTATKHDYPTSQSRSEVNSGPVRRTIEGQHKTRRFWLPFGVRSWLTALMLTMTLAVAIVALESAWQGAIQASSPGRRWASGDATTQDATAQEAATQAAMTQAAMAYLETLTADQKSQGLMKYDAPQRVDWHFIPKSDRKGVKVGDMSAAQRDAAYQLLQESLSAAGYDKAKQIMRLEGLLHELEKSRGGGNIRDPLRYYFTLFGDVSPDGRWGLSVEGHHLSLNFVVADNEVISVTPHAFATNPAEVKETVGEFEKGLRVISSAETLAFDLLNALTPEQKKQAVIAEQPIREVRAPGEAQPPQAEAAGISYQDLDNDQQAIFQALLRAYTENMLPSVAKSKLAEVESHGGFDRLHFAWAGAHQPGSGHYYRIQGPTVLIEFVNTQPDAAGNPANHIHSVWRDPRGDFAIPIESK